MVAIPVEDRIAIEALIISLATAIDSMGDMAGVLAHFTEDGVYDLSAAGLAKFEGHAGISSFFTAAWAAHSHFAHFISNFAITDYAADTSSAQVYATGHALTKDGARSAVQARYAIDVVRTRQGWKISRHATDFLLPPG
jgi:ketosteroid isomerase-like protein